tara:strand:- start:142 stop:255 length:114 start_codon:yes stop_codon:yes gene_type:complete
MKRVEVYIESDSEGGAGEDGEDECGNPKTHGGGICTG